MNKLINGMDKKGENMEIIKLENKNGELTATSLEVARVTGKQHAHVLRDIRDEFDNPNLDSENYTNSRGKTYEMYILDEYQTIQLMSRYSKEVRTMVINEFKRMKEYIKEQESQPKTTVQFLIEATQHIEALQERNVQLTDNLKAYEKYGTSVLVREFVKTIYSEEGITIKEKDMWQLLDGTYLDKKRLPYANYKKYFEVRSVVKNGKIRNTTKISPKGVLYFTNKLLKMREEA